MAKAYGSAARTQAAEKIKDNDLPDFMSGMDDMDDMGDMPDDDMGGMPQEDEAPVDAPTAPSGALDQGETEELLSIAQGRGKSMAEALEIVEIVEEFMAGGEEEEDEGMPMDMPMEEEPEEDLEEEV